MLACFPRKRRSAFLFATTIKRLRKKVQTISQGLKRTSRINAPDIARRTKFKEMKIISAKISFLKYSEYSCVTAKKMSSMKKKSFESRIPNVKEKTARRKERKAAVDTEIEPDAIGRCFFSSW